MPKSVVITGLGLVTAMGNSPADLLCAIQQEQVATTRPGPEGLGDVRIAAIGGFEPEIWVPEPKTIRMMSRDAQLAVAAATLAMRDSGIAAGQTYAPHEIGLFGATGLAGITLDEVSRLVQTSADENGQLDLLRFGAVALRQVRPVLSFKILANMPMCFVSIFLNIQGPNAIFNPWEGQGAQAIVAGAECIRHGEAAAVLVGGCDVKTHELGLTALKQQGVLNGDGLIVGEGAGFLVLEDEARARSRGARIYARLKEWQRQDRGAATTSAQGVVLAAGTSPVSPAVQAGWGRETLSPKDSIGDLFAAAAAIQLATAAQWCFGGIGDVLACCFGHGGQGMSFHLEPA